MKINEWVSKVHANAVDKGFWNDYSYFKSDEDAERGVSSIKMSPDVKCAKIALMHSELSEAVESIRKGEPPVFFEGTKPEGVGVELADCVIRIMDYCGAVGINLEDAIAVKHTYNVTRPYKHGKVL